MKSKTSVTEADRAYNILFNMIAEGELPPGEKLTRRRMAEIAGTSVIPVTEAASRLESVGLLTKNDNGQTSVALPTPEEMIGKYYLREAIECKVVEILCEKGLSKKQQVELLDLADLIDPGSELSKGGLLNGKTHVHYHQLFHQKLANCTGFKCFEDIFYSSSMHFLILQFKAAYAEIESTPANASHRKIVEHIIAGNKLAVCEMMKNHIYNASTSIMQKLVLLRQKQDE